MINPQTLNVILTALLVLVTTIYAYLTSKIVRASEGQRTAAANQVEVAANQLIVTQSQLEAANRQLDIARETLESERKNSQLENDRDGFLRLLEIMEASRQDREFVRDCRNQHRKPVDLNKDEIDRVDRVCRTFDILGLFDRQHLINSHLVDEFYAPPFIELYKTYLKDYVEDLRQENKRGKTHYWELVQFYERVESVISNHPGLTGASNWPDDSRIPRMT